MANNAREIAGEEGLITIKEAASVLRCRESYIYTLIHRGKLPTVKLGRRFTRIKKKDVLALIEQHYGIKGKGDSAATS
jgi:excisionase family DNA binding protein